MTDERKRADWSPADDEHTDTPHCWYWSDWAIVLIDGEGYWLYVSSGVHREVLGLKQDDPRKGDHRFHRTLDNRKIVDGKVNLRIATVGQNSMNSRRHRDNRSGFKGVSFHKGSGKWQARIRKNGTQIFLGTYETPETAYAAYCDAANTHHGEFARLQ
jgi:hypothetical protein